LALTNTTTTVITTTNVNQGFQLQVDTQSNTQIVGNFVTDVSIQPYIATQVISFYAQNMRPNQRMHIFFDSVLVDQYCAPGIKVSEDTSTYQSIARAGDWGTAVYSDVSGHVAGQFCVPANTFKTGDRILELTDVDSLSRGNDAMTTMASAAFTASNLSVSKQIITLTTVNPILSYIPVTNTIVTVNTFTNVTVTPDVYNIYEWHWEPIAQGLTINTPSGEAGVFATSLDLYFKQGSQVNNGVGIYLCETVNGYPDGSTILPFSWVHKANSEISISQDASVPTKFTFESPVFLANQKEYAFVIKPDQNDPDFFCWSANLGDLDVKTGVQVTSQPVIGTAFYGSTVHEWTALQTEYIKFNLNIANFSQSNGVAYFMNTDDDYLTMYNIGYSNNRSILTGDVVYQATNSYVDSTSSTVNTSVHGVVQYFDPVRQLLYVANSTGNFTGNSYIQIHRFTNSNPTAFTANINSLVAYSNTYIMYNPRINATLPEFAQITPPGTSINYTYVGTSNSYTTDASEIDLQLGYETELFDYERLAVGKSNEVSNMGGNKSVTVNAYLKSDSPLISPVIDTVRSDVYAIRNLIDPITSVYEEFYNNGASRTKYISQVITLADGQDSEDLQVVVSAHRPPSSDIQVWVKFWNGSDSESITDKTWTPMRNLSNQLFCDPSNPGDFREFVFSSPYSYPLIGANGTITCTNSSPTVTGSGTLFGTQVYNGWYINMVSANANYKEVSRKIISVANSTQITLDSPFIGNYTSNAYFIVPPPTTGYLASNSSTQITGRVTTSTTNNTITGYSTTFVANTTYVNNVSEAISLSNANTYFLPGDRIYYYVPTGNTAIGGLTGNTWYYIASSNTSTVSLAQTSGGATINLTGLSTNPGEVHGFSSTNFTYDLSPGGIIQINGDQQKIVSIANSVSLTVGTPWSSAVTQANAYAVTTAGITYQNRDGSQYTGYKKFQIKIVLQSNDSSKVPILDDLRAMALQL